MINFRRVRGLYAGPWEKISKIVATPRVMRRLAMCIIDILKVESKKDFTKRGWTGGDPKGGPPIWDSFAYQIRGRSTIEITSSFYGMPELASAKGIPSRRMVWLTQEAKDKAPQRYKRTKTERKRKMRQSGRVSKGERMPLIVPLKASSGQVILRMAPLKFQDAWVHPGIAKFTFVQRAIRKGRKQCAQILAQEIAKGVDEGKSR
jgi:hypothetical protein